VSARPPFVPRDYQVRAADELAQLFRTHRRIVAVAPTGAGKTGTAALITTRALARGRRVLFLAHRKELLDQAFAAFAWAGVPRGDLSVVRGADPRYAPAARVQIASVLTLKNRPLPPADVVMVDECHRAGNPTTTALLEKYPRGKILGLTATPVRGKGSLKDSFDHLYIVAPPSALVAGGYIVAPEGYTVPDDLMPDVSRVRTDSTGDYDRAQLAEASTKVVLVGAMVDHYLLHGQGLPALMFAVSVAHSKLTRDMFLARGLAASHVDGTMPDAERQAEFDKLRSGATRVLCSVDIAIEGLDLPEARVAILGRKTKSVTVHLQSVGRVARPFGGLPSVIIDHVGNLHAHGLPDEDREWSLDAPPRHPVSVKTCPKCFRVVPTVTRECPGMPGAPCDHVWRAAPPEEGAGGGRVVVGIDGRLARVDRAATAAALDERLVFWRQTCQTAVARGYAAGWARLKYEEKFGAKPRSDMLFPPRPQRTWDDVRRRKELETLRATEMRINKPQGWAAGRYAVLFDEPVEDLVRREAAAPAAAAALAQAAMDPDLAPLTVDL
jgi:superfamily II DNA or RNA helicase